MESFNYRIIIREHIIYAVVGHLQLAGVMVGIRLPCEKQLDQLFIQQPRNPLPLTLFIPS